VKRPVPFGKYYLLDRISVGGMAEVFKAKAVGVEGFEKLIAIKRILPNIAEDKEFIEMFKDEAKIAVQLTHANIAQIFELGKIDDSFYIALEFIHGRDLRSVWDRMRKQSRVLSAEMAAFVCEQLLRGLDYAHHKRDSQGVELGIVHRDVSPQNVLISYEGEVKLIDFGIAKAASKGSRTQAGILKGKFSYMSPEQVKGDDIDNRSDIFSLGIVLWELVVGERLFASENDFSTLEKIKAGRVAPPTTRNGMIPEELERIILKALENDRTTRYQTAGEMANDLRAFLTPRHFGQRELSKFMRETYAVELERERQQAEQGADSLPPLMDSLPPLSAPSNTGSGTPSMRAVSMSPLPGGMPLPPRPLTPPAAPPGPPLGGPAGPLPQGPPSTWGQAGRVGPPSPPLPPPSRPTTASGGNMQVQPTAAAVNAPSAGAPPNASGLDIDWTRAPSRRNASGWGGEPSRTGSGPSNTGRPVAPPRPLTQPARPKSGTWLLLVFALVAAGLGVAAYLWVRSESAPPPESADVPAAPEAAKGRAVIHVVPPDATVTVDGKPVAGVQPFEVADLAVGPHQLKVTRAKFLDYEATIEIRGGDRVERVVELEPIVKAFGSVRIETTPPGATLTLDGRLLAEVTPATLRGIQVGYPHKMVATKEGFDELDVSFELSKDETKVISERLEAERHKLNVDTDPAGAIVSLRGERLGGSPVRAEKALACGATALLEVRLPGFSRLQESVTPTAEECKLGEVRRQYRLTRPGIVTPEGESNTGPAGAGALLSLESTPSAFVELDGKRLEGATPMHAIPVKPGNHNVRLFNRQTGCDRTFTVAVNAGEELTRIEACK
jgi:eukaryotic-like serine/threonine-protein kinase